MKFLLILLWVMSGLALPSVVVADLFAYLHGGPWWSWFVFIDLIFSMVFIGFAGLWWNIFGSIPGCS